MHKFDDTGRRPQDYATNIPTAAPIPQDTPRLEAAKTRLMERISGKGSKAFLKFFRFFDEDGGTIGGGGAAAVHRVASHPAAPPPRWDRDLSGV